MTDAPDGMRSVQEQWNWIPSQLKGDGKIPLKLIGAAFILLIIVAALAIFAFNAYTNGAIGSTQNNQNTTTKLNSPTTSVSTSIPESGPPGTVCLAQSGYMCLNPLFFNSSFAVVLGQAIGTDWVNVDFLWVPQGESFSSKASSFCPPAGSNSVSGGISCYNVNNLYSGKSVTANFIFNTSAIMGSTVSGVIWAEYQNITGGNRRIVWIADAVLKAK